MKLIKSLKFKVYIVMIYLIPYLNQLNLYGENETFLLKKG